MGQQAEIQDVAAFVAARLDDDEAAARGAEASWPPPWRASAGMVLDSSDGLVVLERRHRDSPLGYVARHDPARVLRDVAADREILAFHERTADIVVQGEEAIAEG
ncbi:MAG: DUF6221 family protein, partial [Actinomycetota bacterium]|nr:DUF6221 family protein [Actinomycetota bacterium]